LTLLSIDCSNNYFWINVAGFTTIDSLRSIGDKSAHTKYFGAVELSSEEVKKNIENILETVKSFAKFDNI